MLHADEARDGQENQDARTNQPGILFLLQQLKALVVREVLNLAAEILIYLAAEPYTDAEIYDPFFNSEDYELAREVEAIHRLLTGRLATKIGAGRVIQLLGAARPLPGLGLLMVADRETQAGDLVFLAFEYDEGHDDGSNEDCETGYQAYDPPQSLNLERIAIAVFRTNADNPCSLTDRVEHIDPAQALIEFYSDRQPREAWL